MAFTTQPFRLKYRRTKIIATLGPASDTYEAITSLIEAGVNIFRLNMSHGTHEQHARMHTFVREIANANNTPIATLVDLSGPKIRTGIFANGQIELKKGQEVTITTKDVIGSSGLIPSQYEGIVRDVSVGSKILLDDAQLELEVLDCKDDELRCRVIHGGVLRDHKGINLPDCSISAPALTAKDKEDAQIAMKLGADFIALSFVKHADDIIELRKLLDPKTKIIAKIETKECLEHVEAIVDAADGIMIARGDLGAELPLEEVPLVQDQLIRLSHEKMKPVIVATQMLESMITHPRPTRAEVTDVSHAVQIGADAIMLSGETAAGSYPIQAVKIMDRIARHTEAHAWKSGLWGVQREYLKPIPNINYSISRATGMLSKELMVRGLFVISESHMPFLALSAAKPSSPIIAITDNLRDYRQFTLLWGVIPIFYSEAKQVNVIEAARKTSVDLKLGDTNDLILVIQADEPSIRVVKI